MTEMVASAARVELNRFDLCKRIRSCSIISFPGSAVTKRASRVSSGIFLHQNRAQVVAVCEVAHGAINPFNVGNPQYSSAAIGTTVLYAASGNERK
jgi:hypothetical protein